MIRLFLFGFFAFLTITVLGQNQITLEQCHQKALEISPLQQEILIQETISQLKAGNLTKANYPLLQVIGKASYQSDVFSFVNRPPGFEQPLIPKDQYQLYLEVNQNIYNGGYTKRSKFAEDNVLALNQQAVEVDLFQIKKIVNQLFFGTLILQEKVNLLEVIVTDLNSQLTVVQSRVKNGLLFSNSEMILRKEILGLEQEQLEAKLDRIALLEMLSSWVGIEITEDFQLIPPENTAIIDRYELMRPEQRLFELNMDQLDAQKKVVSTALVPRLGLFGQAGIGEPNPLNFFEVDLSSYYLIGVRLTWQPWDWGAVKSRKEILDARKNIITVKKEDFERTLGISLVKDFSEMNKLEELISKDIEIIEIQESIVDQAFSQFKNGVISSTDYVAEVNSETRARLNLKIHEIQLIQTQVNYLTRSGNF